MIYRCLIVDDEPPAVKVLEKYIETVPQLEVCGTCKNAFEVLNLLSDRKIDILFLDVHMPKLFGTELLKTIPQPPKVIFTTAHKEFAVEAFELNAVDYLLKPISFERFLKAVNKILQTNVPVAETASSPVSFVYFRSERKMIKVFLEEILYVESFRDYVVIHMKKGRELKVKIPLNHVERMLPENQFIRIHRSYLVSLSKITAFTKTDVEINKVELPIGKSYTQTFRRLSYNISDLPDGVAER
ncbi:two component transcriptional regulator, LytTR family [Salinimicrobium sediminis]|uniref:Two component transcriptional regulator, LytTR family n=1 Tax=Salinimicrobium sediminis TaxID=1343891 RepID=A0A285X5C6_9FLAO|nr:LytTR family DNA-binding domain-containing protein [Salinimicrobium sediminis]SOC80525.1 two component transcriptional regulator, LytTR family [Salinimicrobium sediminis]